MKRSWIAAIALVTSAALLAPVERAGACSVYCEQGQLDLELVEVRLVRPAAAGTQPSSPTWGDFASLVQDGRMFVEDREGLSVDFDSEVL